MIDIIIDNAPAIIAGIVAVSGWAYGYITKVSASESKAIVDALRSGLAYTSEAGAKLSGRELLNIVSKVLDAIEG